MRRSVFLKQRPAVEALGCCEAEAVPPERNERQAARRRGGHEGEDDCVFQLLSSRVVWDGRCD